ncbi:MAG: hypothetical protein IJ772_03270, partial [Bacilli bacterium]|nr:hypothetical protein [Bacilli bacterium]
MKKKTIGLMVVAIFAVLLMPVLANAQEKVTIYFFRGDGCPHCADAEEFFDQIKEDEELKDKFEIKDYEVWYNKDNQKLAEKAAKAMGETLGGVPYIVIGEKSWNGFTDAYGEEIKEQILELYDKQDYKDPVKEVIEGKKSDSTITIVIIVLVIIAIGVGMHFARRDVEEIPMEEENSKEESSDSIPEEKKETDEKETETYKPTKVAKKTTSNNTKK